LGYDFNRNDIDVLYAQFLELADKLKEVKDEDLQPLAEAQKTKQQ
jgi:2-isopropylmalate synthase